MRHEQDSLNPRTHANIMVLSYDGQHPYWYARILGVFHALVLHPTLQEPVAMDFLWVRWYGSDPDHRRHYGWKSRRLHRIGFVEHSIDEDSGVSPAFGFVNSAHVIRGAHIIPAFHSGLADDMLLPSSTARLESENDMDWNFYYVNV